MGIKDLWSVLTPHCERKPISELRGKIVAIDLAGWVCESLNVVDYFVHPRHHLKNLFFRTCYLLWEEVTPIFVLEGTAPKLKSQVIAKRNELQFRGTKPKNKDATQEPTQSTTGRTRFNQVLKQCENLLQAMGIQCVKGPGEAEAYCAFLNKKGLVDGVISQDSDCFAYGAERVYRNFSVSTQGALAAQGGAVDIYDMRQIKERIDMGQQKVIVMALLCGCDYCPDGVGGVGRDGVIKLFNKYKDEEVLERIRSWRQEDAKYTALEMRVDDKNICSNCGHMGRTQSHTRSGCGVCRTPRGCNEQLWKEERLSLKVELAMRKKALLDATFPCEEVIAEFLSEPNTVPNLNLNWKQPNIVKFIRQTGHLLQWTEIYCFQKFLPILTRWQVRNSYPLGTQSNLVFVQLKEIVKKRIQKGVPSLEVIWHDQYNSFKNLIPHEQLMEYEKENSKGLQELWTTVEPYNLVEAAYPEMLAAFLKSKEKPKKAKKTSKNSKLLKNEKGNLVLGSLENLQDLKMATEEIAKTVKPKCTKTKITKPRKSLQMIDKFLKKQEPYNVDTCKTPQRTLLSRQLQQCSTPLTTLPSDLDSDGDDELDISDIVNGIVRRKVEPLLKKHAGHRLHYESLGHDINVQLKEVTFDDLDLMAQKRNLSISQTFERETKSRCVSLDDSFDVMVNKENHRILELLGRANQMLSSKGQKPQVGKTHLQRFKQQQQILHADNNAFGEEKNVSYFFNKSGSGIVEDVEMDDFEKLMAQSFSRKLCSAQLANEEIIMLSDSSNE